MRGQATQAILFSFFFAGHRCQYSFSLAQPPFPSLCLGSDLHICAQWSTLLSNSLLHEVYFVLTRGFDPCSCSTWVTCALGTPCTPLNMVSFLFALSDPGNCTMLTSIASRSSFFGSRFLHCHFPWQSWCCSLLLPQHLQKSLVPRLASMKAWRLTFFWAASIQSSKFSAGIVSFCKIFRWIHQSKPLLNWKRDLWEVRSHPAFWSRCSN